MPVCRLPLSAAIVSLAALAFQTYPALAADNTDLLAKLQESFDHATKDKGHKGLAISPMPDNNNAGLTCTGTQLSPARPDFIIDLPADLKTRRNVLAAITPERGLQIIYWPYTDELLGDEDDMVIPNDQVSWANVRNQSSFALRTELFDGLAPGDDKPFGVFLEKGVYQFALINSDDRELLAANGQPFRVVAGCLMNWTPE